MTISLLGIFILNVTLYVSSHFISFYLHVIIRCHRLCFSIYYRLK